jgi:Holliday junction resolvasome RuvABC endonuclease subunit
VRVTGLDISLTSTGLAINETDSVAGDHGGAARIRTARAAQCTDLVADDLRRIRTIARAIGEAGTWYSDLIVVEGPSYGQARQTGEHTRAGLWWHIAYVADSAEVPLLVVPPATLKTYATGKGNASKDDVLAAVVKRYPGWDVTGNDVADAVILCAIGSRLLGHPLESSLPQSHLRALDKLTLPDPGATTGTP